MRITIIDNNDNKSYFFNLPIQLKDYKKCLNNIMRKFHNFSIIWG